MPFVLRLGDFPSSEDFPTISRIRSTKKIAKNESCATIRADIWNGAEFERGPTITWQSKESRTYSECKQTISDVKIYWKEGKKPFEGKCAVLNGSKNDPASASDFRPASENYRSELDGNVCRYDDTLRFWRSAQAATCKARIDWLMHNKHYARKEAEDLVMRQCPSTCGRKARPASDYA